MKSIRYATISAPVASPAFAHAGGHLHPHSIEGWMVGLSVLVLLGAGIAALRMRK